MTNTTPSALRHDIENITDEIIICDGEEFTRAEHAIRPNALSNVDFRRVHGGYNASAGQIARAGFIVR